ncbi:MAG: hypothetical protein RR428_05165 [Coprobacillus sp.]
MKKLDELEQIGLAMNKKYQAAYGLVDGYKYFVNFLAQSKQYTIVTTVKKEVEVGELQEYINTMDRGPFVNYISYTDRVLYISMTNSNQLDVWEMQRIMKNVSAFLQVQGYVQCCRHCGEIVNVDFCNVEGHTDLICASCFQKYETTMPETKPVNLPLGILGALAGSLIGVVAWVVIYQLGIVAGITGFVMSVACLKGYQMLGGGLDKKGIIIGVVIAVVMLFGAEMLALGFEIQSAYGEYGMSVGIMDAMKDIPLFLGEGEVLGAVMKDLLFGYGFMAAASFSYVKNQYRAVTVENLIERL